MGVHSLVSARLVLKMKPTEFEHWDSIGAVTYYRLRQELNEADKVYYQVDPILKGGHLWVRGLELTAKADHSGVQWLNALDDPPGEGVILSVVPLTRLNQPRSRRKVNWERLSATIEQAGLKKYIIKVHDPQ